jgi:4'-phosphopantetheinyl transferase EntD
MSLLKLPHGIAAAVAIGEDAPRLPSLGALSLEDALASLHPDEIALATSMPPIRRRDWVAGRLALRHALTHQGLLSSAPLLADDRGAPILDPTALGSISHKRGLAVALASPASGAHRIGVDVENLASARVDVSARILTTPELDAIATLSGAARLRAVTLRFALKEAIYKAIDPFLRRYVGFREVSVWPAGGTADVETDLPISVEAAWIELADFVICSARAAAP